MTTTNNSSSATHYIVQEASAKMPSSAWGRYKRVAVLEVAAGMTQAPRIDERAKGVVRIVETWERLSVGKTDACAYRVALREAEALAERLNAQAQSVAAEVAS